MGLQSIGRTVVIAAGTAAALAGMALGGTAVAAAGQTTPSDQSGIRHVLLISVDGLHQQDDIDQTRLDAGT